MITARVPGGIRVVMQTDHQSQCGIIAGGWGNAEFTRPEPWEPVACAAQWHDEGWRQWERSAGVAPDGSPRGFVAMDVDEHVAIHRRSIAAAHQRDVVTGMLVGMHCAGLLQRRRGLDGEMPDIAVLPDPARVLVRDEVDVRGRVVGEMGDPVAAADWTWASYRVLQALDLLSLYLTWTGLAHGEEWTLRRVPRTIDDTDGVPITVRRRDDVTCTLHPWPLATDDLAAPVLARVIPDRAYADSADLQAAIRAADPAPVPFRIVRA
jgi:hypothetical protein